MNTVSIIGFGSFGAFLAEKLNDHLEVKVYSHSGKPNQWATTLEDAAKADYLILSVPLETYRKVLEEIKPLLRPDTVIVDVCSVKEEPARIIQEILPLQPRVMTHPLFGPESASDTLVGHTIVLCTDQSTNGSYADIKRFCERLELKIIELTSEEHDREIAVVQGLTFFVARTLTHFGIHRQKLSTPSFARLLHLAELEEHHSEDLFRTIQQGNPYTEEMRNRFLAAANEIDARLKEVR